MSLPVSTDWEATVMTLFLVPPHTIHWYHSDNIISSVSTYTAVIIVTTSFPVCPLTALKYQWWPHSPSSHNALETNDDITAFVFIHDALRYHSDDVISGVVIQCTRFHSGDIMPSASYRLDNERQSPLDSFCIIPIGVITQVHSHSMTSLLLLQSHNINMRPFWKVLVSLEP